MKNLNKKTIFVLVIILISSIMTLQSTAGDLILEEYNHGAENYTYTYDGIDAEKAEQIVKSILGVSDDVINISPANIFCLFGHDIKTGAVTMTEHNYYASAPKCKVTTSYVEYCNRDGCSYYKVNSEYISYGFCH